MKTDVDGLTSLRLDFCFFFFPYQAQRCRCAPPAIRGASESRECPRCHRPLLCTMRHVDGALEKLARETGVLRCGNEIALDGYIFCPKKKKKKKKKRKKKAAAPSRLRYQCARPRCFPATDHPLIIFIYFSLVLHSSQFITEDPDSAPEEGEIVEDDDAEADPPSEPAEEPAKKRPRLDDAEDMDPERLAFLDFIGRRPPHIPPVQPLFPPKIGRL
jgi:hypothetical protein